MFDKRQIVVKVALGQVLARNEQPLVLDRARSIATVVLHSNLIYRSQNGDVWHLICEAPSARILVRHTASAGSGGKITDLPVEDFLSINGAGPEHSALRTLLTKLAQAG